jgi:DNA-binding HxlR family transcriptional regulator
VMRRSCERNCFARSMEYRLAELGRSLGAAFCGVWIWAEKHWDEIERARKTFGERAGSA